MKHITVPTPYQMIEEVRGVQPLTVVAWDESHNRKVWMTAVPESTTVDQALDILRRIDGLRISEMDSIAYEGVRWLVRPIPDNERERTTYREHPRERSVPPEVAVWPRRLAWTLANGLAFGAAYWWSPDWLSDLPNIAYYTVGAAVFALLIGGAQWTVLRSRLVRPFHWFAVAGIGQIIDWLLYSRFHLEIPNALFVTPLVGMGVAAALHLVFNKEAIRRPKLWLLLYPLMWALSWVLLTNYDPSAPTFSFGLLAGLAIGLVTSFTVRLRTKAEESFG